MLKTLSAIVSLAFSVFPLAAQQTVSPEGSSTPQSPGNDLPSAPLATTQPAAAYKEVPFVSIAVGFTYLQTDLTDVPGGAGSYQLGWYGIPELHLTNI